MEKQWGFVWRESIYKNNFRCPKCGAKLFDKQPTDNLCLEAGEDGKVKIINGGELAGQPLEKHIRCYCKCKEPVGIYKELNTDLKLPEGQYGQWGGQ